MVYKIYVCITLIIVLQKSYLDEEVTKVDVVSECDPVSNVMPESDPVPDVMSESDPVCDVMPESDPVHDVTSESDPVPDVTSESDPVPDVNKLDSSLTGESPSQGTYIHRL